MAGEIRVLHVDDSESFAGTAAEFLEREDDRIEVVTETSAGDALDRLSGEIDCVVSDYQMPDMDGVAFLEAVRAAHPELPFVLFTGKGSEEVASEALSAGATDYLQKGAGTEQYALLANRIRNAVSRYRSRQRAADLERVRSLVREINRALVRADSREAIERRVCEIVSETRPYRFAWIGDADPETGEVVPRAEAGVPIDVDRLRVTAEEGQYGQGPVGRAFRTGELQVVQETDDLPLAEWRAFADEHDIASLAVVPLVHGETSYGILDVYADRPGAFDDDEQDLLRELGDDVAHAIHARVARSRRIDREEKIETLHDTARSLMRAERADEAAGIAVDAVRDILGMEINSVHLHDEDAEGLVPVAWTDGAADLFGEIPTFPAGESLAWEAYVSGTRRAYEDVSAEPGRLNPGTEMRSEIILPIEGHGVAIIGSTEPDAFEEVDVSLAGTVAAHLESALDRIEREAELRRQNERLEEFASVVSHDLRNPLNVAEGRLELARETLDETHLDAVERAHDRIERLIGDLLDLARLGEGAGDLEPVDLRGVLDRCWSTLETGEATLDVEAPPTIMADEGQVRRLFENLIRNAVEHAGEDVTITVGPLPGGFYVEDDGPGIPEETRDDVFETGYSTSDEGTGFGLSIVAGIAEAHGWTLTLADGTAGGARFEVTGVDVESRPE